MTHAGEIQRTKKKKAKIPSTSSSSQGYFQLSIEISLCKLNTKKGLHFSRAIRKYEKKKKKKRKTAAATNSDTEQGKKWNTEK